MNDAQNHGSRLVFADDCCLESDKIYIPTFELAETAKRRSDDSKPSWLAARMLSAAPDCDGWLAARVAIALDTTAMRIYKNDSNKMR